MGGGGYLPFVLVSPLLLSLDPFDHPSGQLSTFGGRLDGWVGRRRGRRRRTGRAPAADCQPVEAPAQFGCGPLREAHLGSHRSTRLDPSGRPSSQVGMHQSRLLQPPTIYSRRATDRLRGLKPRSIHFYTAHAQNGLVEQNRISHHEFRGR